MSRYFCGVDFGTTNSSVAVAGSDGVRVLEVDARNDNPASLPSLLYLSREGERIVGREAASAFIERNVGREVETKTVDLDVHIEGYVGSEPDKDESYRRPEFEDEAPREAVRARATVQVNVPGRLFQSLKSLLRHTTFRGTEVFGELYQIEELTAMILRRMKVAADHATGGDIETAVFGRPVHFSRREDEDHTAERRLRVAAELAGFKDVVFFYEPVAACVEYAVRSERKQRLMVVDIGGGTCDVCVMEFGGARGAAQRLAQSRILGVSGVAVAGDAIDREITRAKLYPCFGSKSRYGPSRLPVPQNVINCIADWQNLYRLNTEDTTNWLVAVEMSSDQPEAIRALRCLIQKNYGYPLNREVELAKKRLSFEEETRITFHEADIHLDEHLERSEFKHIIEHNLETMLNAIKEAESRAQLKPGDIDFVLTTGGTSLVPAVGDMLGERYGRDRLLQRDTFVSVATGLAVVAQHL